MAMGRPRWSELQLGVRLEMRLAVRLVWASTGALAPALRLAARWVLRLAARLAVPGLLSVERACWLAWVAAVQLGARSALA